MLLSAGSGAAEVTTGATLSRLDLRDEDGQVHELTESAGASIYFEDPDSAAVKATRLHPGLRAPSGAWYWHLEGPGWIGLGETPDQVSGSGALLLSALAVPSCRAELVRSSETARLARLEVHSETWNAKYSVDPGQRRVFEIPRGRFGLVFRNSDGLAGIAAPLECDGKSPLQIQVPSPPGPGLESTLLRLSLPSDSTFDARVEVVLRELGTASLREVTEDVLRVRARGRDTLFFVNRASRPAEILAEGPEVKSLRELLPEQDRAVREVALQVYPRATLAIDTDYRPSRPHGRATLGLLRCHDAAIDAYALGQRVARGECEEVATSPLRIGLGRHRFDRLDRGAYVLVAQIDQETLTSEAFAMAPVIGAADLDVVVPDPWLLQEFEIFGQILESGRPVPGVVRVSGHLEDHSRYQEFSTDEDLLYHWTYFGRPFRQRGDYPWKVERDEAGPGALLAAEPWARVQACVEEGGCFVAASEAYFVGEGRFDIVLPATAPIALTVLDAETETPIAEAKVLITGRRFNLAFHRGVVRTLDAPGFRDELLADSDGRLLFRLPDEPNLEVLVARRGYQPHRLDLAQARAAERGESIVRLRPKPDASGGTAIRDAQGAPVAGAEIVVVGAEEDRLRVHCSERTDLLGVARLPASCRLEEALGVLVVHRAAGTILVAPRDLADQPELRLSGSPGPLVIQVRHADGSPAVGRGVWLGIEGRALPAELYWLMRAEGRIPDLVTDDQGELKLVSLLGEDEWYVSVENVDGRESGPMHRLYTRGTRRSVQVVLVED